MPAYRHAYNLARPPASYAETRRHERGRDFIRVLMSVLRRFQRTRFPGHRYFLLPPVLRCVLPKTRVRGCKLLATFSKCAAGVRLARPE